MILKGIIFEDFINYKKPSMVLEFPKCSFKCEKECGVKMCQNSSLVNEPNITIDVEKVVDYYINNPITSAVVMQGLEPFDTYQQLLEFIIELRKQTDDDVVIYTGYYKDEIDKYVKELSKFKNIIIKFGRFIPDQKEHYDEILGIKLMSNNQYAEKIS